MPNKLILQDRRRDPWGQVNATVFWEGGGQDSVWVNSSGNGTFEGRGIVEYIKVAGEEIMISKAVKGDTSIIAISKDTH